MELLDKLQPEQVVVLGIVVAGITELYSRVVSEDYKTAGKIVVAVVAGTLIALNFGLEFAEALAAGFVAPGGVSVIGSIGNKSKAEPTKLLGK